MLWVQLLSRLFLLLWLTKLSLVKLLLLIWIQLLKVLWGGILILGNAKGSFAGGVTEVQIEGIPASDTNGLYGGSNDADNSGVLKYISIRHGGANIGEGNEINGLTLGGVGSGTVIENIEVVANQDDGIEWFGGTVSVKNALVWNSGDDAVDTDQAWAGTLDNFIVICGYKHRPRIGNRRSRRNLQCCTHRKEWFG